VILNKAQQIAQQNQAELSIIHIIEPLIESSYLAFDGTIATDILPLQNEIEASANTKLKKLAASIGLSEKNIQIEFGRPSERIHDLSKKIPCDLIVMGSHGRHGLALLLGSTANAIMHGASCDVLAVRVGE